MTSHYAVIEGKSVINKYYQEKSIIISYNPLENKFEVGYEETKKDKEWIYNISDVFASNTYQFITKYIQSLKENRDSKGLTLTDQDNDRVSENINSVYNYRNHSLPVLKWVLKIGGLKIAKFSRKA